MINDNAIVLSGHLRTFENVQDRIFAFIKSNRLDVYMHLWKENDSEQRVQNIVAKLKPVKYLVEDQLDFIEKFQKMEKNIRKMNPKENYDYEFVCIDGCIYYCQYPDTCVKNIPKKTTRFTDKIDAIISMHYSRYKAYQLIEKKYDSVIYSRYDLDIKNFNLEGMITSNPNKVIIPEEQSYGLSSDIFAIVPQKYVDSYFLYPRIEKLLTKKFDNEFKSFLRTFILNEKDIEIHDKQRYCPHMLGVINYYEEKCEYVIVDVPVKIIRG